MRVRIDSTWLTTALAIAAGGAGLMYPNAGIALIILAVLILLLGVRIDGWHLRILPIWRRTVSIQEAARISFETAEEIGILELVKSVHSDPQNQLSYFLYAFLSDERIQVYGKKSPSTKLRIIRQDELRHLHPVAGKSSLRSDFAASPDIYEDVAVNRHDFKKYLQRLKNLRELGEREI